MATRKPSFISSPADASLMTTTSPPRPAIMLAFSCPGILGFVFIEGQPCDIADAVHGLVTVFQQRSLVPSEEHSMLLSIQNPIYHDIPEGEWVRCRHRLYCGDIGLICECDNSSKAELIVAFLPQIPDKSTSSAPKCKRPMCPKPRKWCTDLAKAVWGEKVQKISDEEYKLNHETYKVGLILKRLPPASVAISNTPQDIGPFLAAPFLANLPFYSSVAFHFAQDMIKVRHWVKVTGGEQQGIVGHVIDVSNGTAKVALHNDNKTAPLLIFVHGLSNSYLPGDHIKPRFADSCGIVSAVSEEDRMLTFVEKDTLEEVCLIKLTQPTLIYLVRSLYTWTLWSHGPPANYYHFTTGLWVQFTGPIDSRRLKRHRYITKVEDGLVTIVDKHTFAEVSNKLLSAELANIRPKFDIDTAELEVAASQGPSIPTGDRVHPLVGQWVIIMMGPHKGYKGVV